MMELPEVAHTRGDVPRTGDDGCDRRHGLLFPLLFGCSSEGFKDTPTEADKPTRPAGRCDARRTNRRRRVERCPQYRNTGCPRPDRPPELDRGEHQHARAGTRNLPSVEDTVDEAEELIDNPKLESFDSGGRRGRPRQQDPEALGCVPGTRSAPGSRHCRLTVGRYWTRG